MSVDASLPIVSVVLAVINIVVVVMIVMVVAAIILPISRSSRIQLPNSSWCVITVLGIASLSLSPAFC